MAFLPHGAFCPTLPYYEKKNIPGEEFELTANSLAAHIETHGGLILETLSYLTVNSHDDYHCELSMSLQLKW